MKLRGLVSRARAQPGRLHPQGAGTSILREWARVLVSGLPTGGPANRESLTPSERNIRHSQLPGDSCKGELLPAQVRADTEITMV